MIEGQVQATNNVPLMNLGVKRTSTCTKENTKNSVTGAEEKQQASERSLLRSDYFYNFFAFASRTKVEHGPDCPYTMELSF